LKKPTGSVQFQFYKPETEKTKPKKKKKQNQTELKPSHTKKIESNSLGRLFMSVLNLHIALLGPPILLGFILQSIIL
jgi:hypothetical protein